MTGRKGGGRREGQGDRRGKGGEMGRRRGREVRRER